VGKHKSVVAALALVGGGLGVHRFYLHGFKDVWAWAHWPFFWLGAAGVARFMNLGQDDKVAWALLPIFGLVMAAGMLGGIVYGLMDDDAFNARFNAGQPVARSGWASILPVIACLLVGTTLTMASIAFGFQKFFEWQIEEARKISR
jgi:TM2 domain-containing membrane protein YozV